MIRMHPRAVDYTSFTVDDSLPSETASTPQTDSGEDDDANFHIPLHTAFHCNALMDILKILLVASPESTSTRVHGQPFLHVVSREVTAVKI